MRGLLAASLIQDVRYTGREMDTRRALGAGTGRLTRQVLTASSTLGLLGFPACSA